MSQKNKNRMNDCSNCLHEAWYELHTAFQYNVDPEVGKKIVSLQEEIAKLRREIRDKLGCGRG